MEFLILIFSLFQSISTGFFFILLHLVYKKKRHSCYFPCYYCTDCTNNNIIIGLYIYIYRLYIYKHSTQ
jgi:hypothetical protein